MLLITAMDRQLFITEDGSPSFMIHGKNVTYHSRFGALQESMHVFINAGLKPLIGKPETLFVFEMGFGTGLNAFLTAQQAQQGRKNVHYSAVELFPLAESEMNEMVLSNMFSQPHDLQLMKAIHKADWEKDTLINTYFTLNKKNIDLLRYTFANPVHLVFFDAFDPMEQPELWTTEVFKKLYDAMLADGILVTYCCKGQVRRNLKEAGFYVEKIPGPPGKREITRAYRK